MSKSKDRETTKMQGSSQFVSWREVKMSEEEFRELYVQPWYAQSLIDVRKYPEVYNSLSDSEYLDVIFDEMRFLFCGHNFEGNAFHPVEIDGKPRMHLWSVLWPGAPTATSNFINDSEELGHIGNIFLPMTHWQKYNTDFFNAKTFINFHWNSHDMLGRYEGTFSIKNAVIRAKFVGNDYRHMITHTFSKGEYERLNANLCIGSIKNKGEHPIQAFLLDNSIPPQPVFSELEEFTMLADTTGLYHKKYVEPRAVNEDLVLFTYFNKTRGLYCDTVASIKDGLCDPEVIFDGSSAMDVPADWSK